MSRVRAGWGFALAAIPQIIRELRDEPPEVEPILVAGAVPLATELAGALGAGAGPEFVTVVEPAAIERGAGSVVVCVFRGEPTGEEEALRRADRAGIPIVALVVGEAPRNGHILPYVPATDVVYAAGVDERAVASVLERIAARTGESAPALAREVPLLRSHVARSLVHRYSKKNALVSAAIFIPGADLPVLTINQLRMVRRIADAYGEDEIRARVLMLAGVVGAGLGFRTVARTALGFVPFAGIPIRAAVAFGGTRAVGAAAIRRLESVRAKEPVEPAATLRTSSESTEPGSGERDLDTND